VNAAYNIPKTSVTIQQTDVLLLDKLLETTNTESFTIRACNALSCIIRHSLDMSYTSDRSSFFSPDGKFDISGVLEVWSGYHHSVQALMDGNLIINVDIAYAVFRKGNMSLLDFLKLVAEKDIESIFLSGRPSTELGRYLIGVPVVTTHGSVQSRFKIAGFGTKHTQSNFNFPYTRGYPLVLKVITGLK
jgi:hypothetical protein